MQPRQRGIHRIVDCRAVAGLRIGQMRLPDDMSGDVLHDVKRCADHARIGAIEERPRYRKILLMERADDAEFAVDGMRGRQQLARRLAAQHVAARRALQ